MNGVQPGFPFTRHRRSFDFGMDRLNQPDPFVSGLERLAIADNVFSRDQSLDDRGAGRRGPQPTILHGARQLFVVERLSRSLHRRQ